MPRLLQMEIEIEIKAIKDETGSTTLGSGRACD